MRKHLISLSLLLVLGWTPLFGQGKKKNIQNFQKRVQVARQSAIVIVLCQDGGKTAAGRFVEGLGRVVIAPFVKPFYRTQIWLVGKKATPRAFLSSIRKAAKTHQAVDILLFAHGRPNYTRFGRKTLTTSQLVKGLKGRGGKKIRMVYTTTCYSSLRFLKAWQKVGAWAVRGAPGVNRPLDFPRFFLGWLGGESYEQANRAGFRTNKWCHKVLGRLQPKIKKTLKKSLKALRRSPRGRQNAKLRSFLHLAYRWFNRPWNIEESRPRIIGGRARIDRLPLERQKVSITKGKPLKGARQKNLEKNPPEIF